MGIIGKIVGKVALTVATPAIAIIQMRLLDGIVCAIPTSVSPRELARYQKTLDINMKKIDELVQSNKTIAFVYDFENPFLDYKEAVLREFVDVTDACKIFYEDKSRGSDYGD